MYINLINKKVFINRYNYKSLTCINSYYVNPFERFPIFNGWLRSKYYARERFLDSVFYGEIVVWKEIEIR